MIDLMGKLFGIPWHGLWKKQAAYPNTETFVSTGGSTIPPPEAIQSAGGYSWKIETGAPAVSLTPEEQAEEDAAGRTWLNYGIAYGTPSNIRIGNRTLTGPLYRDDNDDFWMLGDASGNITLTRFGLFDNSPPTVVQTLTPAEGALGSFHNFSPDCRKFAWQTPTTPVGFRVYAISGVPPAATLTMQSEHLNTGYVNITYTGGPQLFHFMKISYVSDPNGEVIDEFFGDPNSTEFDTWAGAYPNLIEGPIGASVVTHKTLTKTIGIMFGDDGATKPVQVDWTQSISRVWCSAWTFTHYPAAGDLALTGSAAVSDSGTYQLKIGGNTVINAPWTASSTDTYQPYLSVNQSLSVLGDAYPDARIVSTWNGGSYNPDPTQASFYAISAVDTPIAFPDQSTPKLEDMLFHNGGFSALMLTNLVAAFAAGKTDTATNHWRFCSRDAELASSNDVINMPLSAPFICTMHPVTHQFERDIDVSALVFV